MKKSIFIKTAIIISLLVNGALYNINAQVTIGSNKTPETFSALEIVSNETRGLRLPQMTTVQRDAMEATPEFQAKKSTEAMGLQIFNITTKCIDTWNGVKWFDVCAEPDCAPAVSYATLTTASETIAENTPLILEVTADGLNTNKSYVWQINYGAGFQTRSTTTVPSCTIEDFEENTFTVRVIVDNCAQTPVTSNELEITVVPRTQMLVNVWIFNEVSIIFSQELIDCFIEEGKSIEEIEYKRISTEEDARDGHHNILFRYDETNMWIGYFIDEDIYWEAPWSWRWVDETETGMYICISDCLGDFITDAILFIDMLGNKLYVTNKGYDKYMCDDTVSATAIFEFIPYEENIVSLPAPRQPSAAIRAIQPVQSGGIFLLKR